MKSQRLTCWTVIPRDSIDSSEREKVLGTGLGHDGIYAQSLERSQQLAWDEMMAAMMQWREQGSNMTDQS